jgi:hypothetical protein
MRLLPRGVPKASEFVHHEMRLEVALGRVLESYGMPPAHPSMPGRIALAGDWGLPAW